QQPSELLVANGGEQAMLVKLGVRFKPYLGSHKASTQVLAFFLFVAGFVPTPLRVFGDAIDLWVAIAIPSLCSLHPLLGEPTKGHENNFVSFFVT
ncbi:MAG: hypothetical protein IKD26_02105, partial [Clostridia bacterium]|nr:hypothetical protein [Clostridia bacterium]